MATINVKLEPGENSTKESLCLPVGRGPAYWYDLRSPHMGFVERTLGLNGVGTTIQSLRPSQCSS